MTACRVHCLATLSVVAVVLAACTVLAPASTPTTSGQQQRAEVELRVAHNVELKRGHTIAVTLSDARQTRTLTQGEFTAIQEGHFIAGPFETATTGDLDVTGALVDVGGTELAKASVDLPLAPDRRYGVWIVVGRGDQTTGCLGCAGSRSVPLDPSLGYARDVSLAIVWGSNSISHPVVH